MKLRSRETHATSQCCGYRRAQRLEVDAEALLQAPGHTQEAHARLLLLVLQRALHEGEPELLVRRDTVLARDLPESRETSEALLYHVL